MNSLIRRTLTAGLLAFALAPLAHAATPVAHDKNYGVAGKLRLDGAVDFSVSNAEGTVTATVASLQNDSTTTTSGPLLLRVFITASQVNGTFPYYTIGQAALNPLLPLHGYTNLVGTMPLLIPPDGLYHAYVGVFEPEGGCGGDGYCMDDAIGFPSRVRVSGGLISNYGQDPDTGEAIGYYHAQFDHYFFTANVDEIQKLDNGTFQGWARTGRIFGVWTEDIGGVAEVCRFFSTSFGLKSSHFYTPFPDECAIVKTNPNWQYEGIVAYLALPDGNGSCPTGVPLYRLYNNGMGGAPNHRYTTSLAGRSDMIAAGWIPEGYGPVGVVGCVPY